MVFVFDTRAMKLIQFLSLHRFQESGTSDFVLLDIASYCL